MLLAVALAWVCNVTGVSCAAPNAEIIQKAYEQEAPSSGVRHDKGLKIAAVMANNFFTVVIAVICLFSVLKISFGWVR